MRKFFGKFLEKYGVDFNVEARRDYKSAMAALTETEWNAKTRENLKDLLVLLCFFQYSYKSGLFKVKPSTIYTSVSSAEMPFPQDPSSKLKVILSYMQ